MFRTNFNFEIDNFPLINGHASYQILGFHWIIVVPIPPDRILAGQTFDVRIFAYNATNLTGYDLFIIYNNSVIRFESWDVGDDIPDIPALYTREFDSGVEIAAQSLSIPPVHYSGALEIARLTFTALSAGESSFDLGVGSKLMGYNVTVREIENVVFQNTTIEVVSLIPGDLDSDGDVDFNDLIATLNLILTGSYDPAADIDNNGEIEFDDLIAVLNIILSS